MPVLDHTVSPRSDAIRQRTALVASVRGEDAAFEWAYSTFPPGPERRAAIAQLLGRSDRHLVAAARRVETHLQRMARRARAQQDRDDARKVTLPVREETPVPNGGGTSSKRPTKAQQEAAVDRVFTGPLVDKSKRKPPPPPPKWTEGSLIAGADEGEEGIPGVRLGRGAIQRRAAALIAHLGNQS